MSLVLKRVARQSTILAVVLAVLIPTGDLAAQPFSKKIPVVGAKNGGQLGSAIVTVQSVGDSTAVKISAPTSITANAFYLANPSRLVVDVSGCKTRRSEKFPLSSNLVISGIRVGAHADKLRLVVDLTAAEKPTFTVAVGGRDVTLTIAEVSIAQRSEQAPRAVKPTARATVTVAEPTPMPLEAQPTQASLSRPTAEPTVVAPTPTVEQSQPVPKSPIPSPSPQVDKNPEPQVTAQVTAQVAAQVTATPLPKATATQPARVEAIPVPAAPAAAPTIRGAILHLLLGYQFEYLEPGRVPVLKIMLNKPRANAQISKIGPRAYKIVVPSCGISGKGLDLPQFPPADFLGFVMVAAKQVDDKAEITVSVEQGVTLGTFVRQNQIWVKRL